MMIIYHGFISNRMNLFFWFRIHNWKLYIGIHFGSINHHFLGKYFFSINMYIIDVWEKNVSLLLLLSTNFHSLRSGISHLVELELIEQNTKKKPKRLTPKWFVCLCGDHNDDNYDKERKKNIKKLIKWMKFIHYFKKKEELFFFE